MAEVCSDNRFEVIARAKQHLLEATNIDTSPDEMAVLDSFLFRCWQMGWLQKYDSIRVEWAFPIEFICEMFGNEAPCNYGLFGVSVDDFMYSECGDWCESNCDKVPAVECWKRFIEAWEKRRNEWQ